MKEPKLRKELIKIPELKFDYHDSSYILEAMEILAENYKDGEKLSSHEFARKALLEKSKAIYHAKYNTSFWGSILVRLLKKYIGDLPFNGLLKKEK